jgi:hypothetical protein
MEIAEPPRDGEFFFEEGGGGARERDTGCPLACFLGRHPLASLASAAALGMLAASVLLKL